MSENENLDSSIEQTPARPTFLTVLCILTFVGSGFGVLGGIFALLGSSFLASFAPGAGGSIIWAVLSLIASGLCLFGAIQMWSLKKIGYFLYLGGSLIAIVVTIINAMATSATVSSMSSRMNEINSGLGNEYAARNEEAMNAVGSVAGGFAWAGAIFGILITIAFVIMYSANKKHLVN